MVGRLVTPFACVSLKENVIKFIENLCLKKLCNQSNIKSISTQRLSLRSSYIFVENFIMKPQKGLCTYLTRVLGSMKVCIYIMEPLFGCIATLLLLILCKDISQDVCVVCIVVCS